MTRAVARRRGVAGAATVACGALLGAAVTGRAQPIDPARPSTIVIGVPAGARTDRVDVGRTGFSATPLPTSGLHTEWRAATGAPFDHAPLVDARGTTYVVSARGEVIAIGRDGSEQWRIPTGAVDAGPAALLSDDTLVVIDTAGNALGVREGAVRWRTHFGGPDPAPVGPLPLDDGGVVVTAGRDLVLLDGQGHERARTMLAERAAAPILWATGRVVVVGAGGTVWTWAPGAREVSRLGSFGAPAEGGAAVVGDRTLVAVIARQTSLSALDLVRGGPAVPRAIAPIAANGTGGTWLGPPAARGEDTTLALLGPTSEIALMVDASGREIGRALLAAHTPLSRADAGPPTGAGLRAPLLIDAAGTLAFETFQGGVGVATLRASEASGRGAGAPGGASMGAAGDGAFEVLADACPPPAGMLALLGGAPPSIAGIAPLPPGSLVVACHSGTLVAVAGAAGASTGGKVGPSAL
jgi:hypothetical protein